jgi:hypothetical protein
MAYAAQMSGAQHKKCGAKEGGANPAFFRFYVNQIAQ